MPNNVINTPAFSRWLSISTDTVAFQHSPATIAQSVPKTASGVNSYTVTVNNVVAGHLLLVCTAARAGGGISVTGVSSIPAETWTQDKFQSSAGVAGSANVWHATATHGGNYTITVSLSAICTDSSTYCFEIAGSMQSPDGVTQADATSNSAVLASGINIPAGDIVFSLVESDTTPVTFTKDGNFTESGPLNSDMDVEYNTAWNAGNNPTTAGWSLSASVSWALVVIWFAPTGDIVTGTKTSPSAGHDVTDTLAFNPDSTVPVTRTATTFRSPTDTLVFNDLTQRSTNFLRSLADTLVFQDSILFAYVLHGARVIQDGLAISDALTRLATVTRSPSDTLVFADTATRTASFPRTIADTLVVGHNRSNAVNPSTIGISAEINGGIDVSRAIWVMKGLWWLFYIFYNGGANTFGYRTSSDGIHWSTFTALTGGNAASTTSTWYDRNHDRFYIGYVSGSTIHIQEYKVKTDGTISTVGSETTFNPINTTAGIQPYVTASQGDIYVSTQSQDALADFHAEVWHYNGSTWKNLDDFNTGQSLNKLVTRIFICTSGLINVVSGGSTGASGAGAVVRFRRSSDGGTTWTEIDSGNTDYLSGPDMVAAYGPFADADIVYASAFRKTDSNQYIVTYKFGNAAVTNELSYSGRVTNSFSAITANGNTIVAFYADNTDILYYRVSTDGGATWSAENSYVLADANAISGGLFCSLDAGETHSGLQVIVTWFEQVVSTGYLGYFITWIGDDNVLEIVNLLSPADTLAFGDALTIAMFPTLLRNIVDTLVFNDFTTRTLSASRTLADTLVFQDVLTRAQGWLRSTTDTLVFDDFTQIVTGQTFLRTVMDTLVFADALTRIQGWMRSNVDTLLLAAVLSQTQSWARSNSDTLIFQDVLQRVQGYNRSLADILVFNDFATRTLGFTRSLADTLIFNDLTTRIGSYARSPADMLTFNDFTQRLQSWLRSNADTLVVQDFVQRIQGWARAITDTIQLADAITRIQGWNRSFADTFVLADLATRTGAFTRSPADTLIFNDFTLDVQGWLRSPSDTLVLRDSTQNIQGWMRSNSDTLVFQDVLTRAQGWLRSTTDTVQIADIVSATLMTGMTRFIIDTLVLGDAMTRTASMLRTVIESFQISDRTSVVKVVIKTPHGRITKYITLRKRMARHEPEDFGVVTN